MSRFQWMWSQLTRRLWFRAGLFSIAGIATALLAIWLKPFIPPNLSNSIGAEAVGTILGIMASSMLAVTTFSLGTMVSAFSGAASSVTPRATSLLIADTTAQNALSTFIGAFLFAIVGIIALSTGLYGGEGRLVLFAVTLLVIAFVIVTLLRWIDYLSRLGRMGETISRVEEAAATALKERAERPFLGGASAPAQPGYHAVTATKIGYLCHVAMADLDAIAENLGTRIDLCVLPGAFVTPAAALARIGCAPDEEACDAMREAFLIEPDRSFDQDPRFGVSVMAEIGSRALSPAVNDPGTAIDVIGRGVRILALWADRAEGAEPLFPHVTAPVLATSDLFDDLFGPLARDGAGTVEVMVRMLKALAALAATGDATMAAEARRHGQLTLERSLEAMNFHADRDAVRRAAAWLDDTGT